MDYSEFLAIGLRIQKLQRRTQSLYELGMDVINFENDYYEVIDLLLKQVFTEKQYDWVSWFIYENDFGQKGKEARDENGNLICQSWESLWEYLNRGNEK
jgi:hypothetical protein